MSAATRLRSWWKALAHRSSLEKEMEAELSFHIESYAQDLVRSGVGPEEAMRRARLELGTIPSQQEDCRSSLGVRPWDDLFADLRYALRQLRHTPAFTVTVLVVLALGIGANAAMFSIVDATLLRWLPYHRPNELVSVNLLDDHGGASWAYYEDLIAWQGQSHTLQSMAYYVDVEGFLETKSAQEPVSAYAVSANLFSVLNVQPAQGRAFLADEQTPGKGRVVILSNVVWRSMLQSDPGIVGKQVTLNDKPYTVVGIMPPRFLFPANDNEPQIWIPAEITPAHFKMGFSEPTYQAIARIQKGSSLAAIGTELSGIEGRQVQLYPQEMRKELPLTRVAATPYRETLVTQSRPALLALVAAVGIMWLIACANVANLMLARSMARQREIAVRGALGASRWRIVRQLFTESLVLSAMGSAAGLGLAQLVLWIFNQDTQPAVEFTRLSCAESCCSCGVAGVERVERRALRFLARMARFRDAAGVRAAPVVFASWRQPWPASLATSHGRGGDWSLARLAHCVRPAVAHGFCSAPGPARFPHGPHSYGAAKSSALQISRLGYEPERLSAIAAPDTASPWSALRQHYHPCSFAQRLRRNS